MKHTLKFFLILAMTVTSIASATAAEKTPKIIPGYDKVKNEMTEVIGFYKPKKQVEFSKKVFQQLEGQQIVSWNIPYVAKKTNDVYFSTFEGLAPDHGINRVYHYKILTKKLKEIFKEEFTTAEKSRLLRTIGTEGNKLLMIVERADDSGIPATNACYSLWVDPKAYVSLDVKKPKSGLMPYTMPAYQVEKGKKEKLGCTPGLIE